MGSQRLKNKSKKKKGFAYAYGHQFDKQKYISTSRGCNLSEYKRSCSLNNPADLDLSN
jgi:hypothetical protein